MVVKVGGNGRLFACMRAGIVYSTRGEVSAGPCTIIGKDNVSMTAL